MSTEDLAEALKMFIENYSHLDSWGDDECEGDNEYPELKNVRVRTYTEASLMTMDSGLVLSFPDGSEYQITIVKSFRSNK